MSECNLITGNKKWWFWFDYMIKTLDMPDDDQSGILMLHNGRYRSIYNTLKFKKLQWYTGNLVTSPTPFFFKKRILEPWILIVVTYFDFCDEKELSDNIKEHSQVFFDVHFVTFSFWKTFFCGIVWFFVNFINNWQKIPGSEWW